MSIIDSIRLSGTTYQIQVTVDAALDSGSTNPVANSAITTALDGKQDTLVSGTNIKTINNQSILGSGNINIQGGGGKAIEAGRGITITTGETADTVSFNLPISAGTGPDSIAECSNTTASGEKSHAEGYYTTASGRYSHTEGDSTTASGRDSHAEGYFTTASGKSSHAEGWASSATSEASHAEGYETVASGSYSHTEGNKTTASNKSEHASGQYNVSSSASTTFGDSGNTLFSVGNGTSSSAKHNAFEIRQNGDIYLTKDGQDVKLQDQLGGGGSSYTAGDGIDITNNVISVTGKADTSAFTAHTADTTIHVTSAEKATWNAKSDFSGSYNDLTNKPTIPTSASQLTNDTGYITSSALDGYATTATTSALNNTLTAHTADTTVHTTAAEKTSWNGAVTNASNAVTALGGLSLIKLTQAQYDALVAKDNNTLYVIVD